MRIRTFALLAGLAVLAGCSDEFNAPEPAPVKVRVVNSVFQLDETGAAASATPRAIDVWFDGSAEMGVVNVPANSVTGIEGTPENITIEEGIHSWSPRLAAPATPRTSLYGNSADPRGEFTPRLFLTPNTQYTLVVAGVAPATGIPAPGAFFVYDFSNRVPLVDDLDPPPVVNDQRLARFRLVNAAPFALGGTTGTTIGLQLTEGSTFPTLATINTLNSITSATYRQQSAMYVNVTPGDYVVNVTTGGPGARRILQQQAVTFEPGQVITVLIQNTAYAATPGPANHKLTVLVDAEYD
jgi:hypothetical protein